MSEPRQPWLIRQLPGLEGYLGDHGVERCHGYQFGPPSPLLPKRGQRRRDWLSWEWRLERSARSRPSSSAMTTTTAMAMGPAITAADLITMVAGPAYYGGGPYYGRRYYRPYQDILAAPQDRSGSSSLERGLSGYRRS